MRRSIQSPGFRVLAFVASITACAAMLLPTSTLAPRAGATGVTTVSIDVADAYLPAAAGSYWVVTSPEVQIPLVLSEPAFGDGFGANTVSSLSPGLGTVVFPPGTTSRNAVRTFVDVPPNEFYPGWLARWGYFNITSAGPNGQVGTPATLYITWVEQAVANAAGEKCSWTFFEALLCALRISGWCPVAAPAEPVRVGGPDPADVVLRRYRDEVLASTANGAYYVTLYDELGTHAVQAIVQVPSLAVRILRSEDEWIPALAALVNGAGGSVSVTQSMQDHLLDIMQSLESAGSPTLANALAFERDRLNLDSIAGLMMTQFQEQIVTLGGPTSVERQSWSGVKGMYRPPQR